MCNFLCASSEGPDFTSPLGSFALAFTASICSKALAFFIMEFISTFWLHFIVKHQKRKGCTNLELYYLILDEICFKLFSVIHIIQNITE